MCGMSGVLASDKAGLDIDRRVYRSLDVLAHRGPDDIGFYKDLKQGVWFGHKRLSIVELSTFGHQPMLSVDGSVAIVFNGEIYNHKSVRAELEALGHCFRGNSDSEVIVEAYRSWGLDCLDKFNGTFALAIHDHKSKKVHFARDRAGEKPLFYMQQQGAFFFSSELTALMEIAGCNRHIDPQGLVSYLTLGYTLGEKTLVKQAKILLPGHWATFDLVSRALSIGRYWTLPKHLEPGKVNEPQSYEQELECLLEDAVHRQLDCDVPTCILLSGGVDSSLLTALAARQASRIKTFTVRFPGHPAFDETPMARLIADHFGTEHTEIDGINLSPSILLNLSCRIDAPINDSSLIPTFLVNEAVSKRCRVSLGGDGADELFGGYKHYARMLRLRPYANISRHFATKGFYRFFKKQIPGKHRFRNWLECLALDLDKEIPNIREIFTPEEADEIIGYGGTEVGLYQGEWRAFSSGHGSVLRNSCASDFQTYLASSILVKSDRASMLNSVEARAPFLDRYVIEFAMGKLPDSLRASRTDRKIILKNLCARILPKEFDLKRKLGFNLPFGEMIRSGEWRDLIFDELQADNGVVSRDCVMKILESHMAGSDHADQIFGLFMLSAWIRNNKIVLA